MADINQDPISYETYKLVNDSGFCNPQLVHKLLSRFSSQIKSYQHIRDTHCDDSMDLDEPKGPKSSSDFVTRITPGKELSEIVASPNRLTRYMTGWERGNGYSSDTTKGSGTGAPFTQEWQNVLKAAIPCVADHQLRGKLISSDEHSGTIIDSFEANLDPDHLMLDHRAERRKFTDILEKAIKIQDPELHRQFRDHDIAFDSRVAEWSACRGISKPRALDPLAVVDYRTELTQEVTTKIVEVYPRLEREVQSEEDGLLANHGTSPERNAKLRWLKVEGDILERISHNADQVNRCYHFKDNSKMDIDVASEGSIHTPLPLIPESIDESVQGVPSWTGRSFSRQTTSVTRKRSRDDTGETGYEPRIKRHTSDSMSTD